MKVSKDNFHLGAKRTRERYISRRVQNCPNSLGCHPRMYDFHNHVTKKFPLFLVQLAHITCSQESTKALFVSIKRAGSSFRHIAGQRPVTSSTDGKKGVEAAQV